MALFGGARKLVQRVENQAWHDDQERDQLLAALRDARPKAAEVLPLLGHGDHSVRRAAAAMYGARAGAADVLALAEVMRTASGAQRAAYAEALESLDEAQVTAALETQLADPSGARLGWELVLALGGGLGRRYLPRAVNEAPAVMRAPALRRLLQVATPDDIADVLVIAAADPDQRLASLALEALSGVEDGRVFELMVERFRDGDAVVRDQAKAWLLKAARGQGQVVRARMLEVMAEGDATRRASLEVLLATGRPEEVLVEVFRRAHGLMGWIRTRVVDALRSFGAVLLEPSVALLDHPEEHVRNMALTVAEAFADPRLVEPLAALLDDDDWWMKVRACDGLGRLADSAAVPYLLAALDDDDCCWAAVDALAQIGSTEAVNKLAHVLKSPRTELRMEVVRAFGAFADERLLALLKVVRKTDPATEVRAVAADVMRALNARLERSSFEAPDEVGLVAVTTDHLERPVDQLLARVREIGGSDVHITVDEPPMVRVGGVLERLDEAPLDAEACERMIRATLDERRVAALEAEGEVDFCYQVPGVGRYRANAFTQRLGLAATFRCVPHLPPTFHEVGLPGHLTELLDYHQGLVVVAGPSGSGKSTTLAAVLNLINETRSVHVLTLEEPIEFVHPVKTALINQREVGKHSDSYARALRGALRQDPDVIMVGELRDPEVIRMALEAAETGHLVVTTMHTTSAVATVERLVTSFPPEEQQQVRMALSDCLQFVVSQQLVPRVGGGRVAVFEVLKCTFNVGNMIRDDKLMQVPSAMQIGRNVGMQTVDDALSSLLDAGLITPETAWRRAEKQETFEHLVPAEVLADVG